MTRLRLWSASASRLLLLVFVSRGSIAQCQSRAGSTLPVDIPGTGYGTNGISSPPSSRGLLRERHNPPGCGVAASSPPSGGGTSNNIAIGTAPSRQPMGLQGWPAVRKASSPSRSSTTSLSPRVYLHPQAASKREQHHPLELALHGKLLGGGLCCRWPCRRHSPVRLQRPARPRRRASAARRHSLSPAWPAGTAASWSSAPAGPGPETEAFAMTVYNNLSLRGRPGQFQRSGPSLSLRRHLLALQPRASTSSARWTSMTLSPASTSSPSPSGVTSSSLAATSTTSGGFVSTVGRHTLPRGSRSSWSQFSTGMNRECSHPHDLLAAISTPAAPSTTASSVLSFHSALWNGSSWNGRTPLRCPAAARSSSSCELQWRVSVAGGSFGKRHWGWSTPPPATTWGSTTPRRSGGARPHRYIHPCLLGRQR